MKRSCAVVGLLCAWVLWQEMVRLPDQFSFWLLVDASEGLKECERLQALVLKDAAERDAGRGLTIEQHSRGYTATKAPNTGHRMRAMCLPAGTDPRPRVKE